MIKPPYDRRGEAGAATTFPKGLVDEGGEVGGFYGRVFLSVRLCAHHGEVSSCNCFLVQT